MRKWGLLLLIAIFLWACHQRTQPAPMVSEPVEQEVVQSAPSAQVVNDVKTVDAAPEADPASTSKDIAADKTSSQADSPVTAQVRTQPIPDQAVFEDEPLINTTDRLLNPYAALPLDPTAAQNAPWAYEQLKYGIYYSFIKAGTAYIRNRGLVHIGKRLAYLLQTSAFSATVIDAVFKVRDINQSWLDASDFYSYGYGQSVREGSYKRDEWLQFDYAAKKYIGQIQKKEAPRDIEGPLEEKVLDILSALYYVRAQELEVGKTVSFDIVNREKQYPLIVNILKKETIKTPAGKFKCIVVEPQFRGEGIFVAKGKNLKVWLTDDAYKMPVQMKVEVFIGSVSAQLLKYKRQAPENIL